MFSKDSGKVFWPGIISATPEGFQVDSVVTPDAFTPVPLGRFNSLSSDRKTLVIRMQYPTRMTYNGASDVGTRQLFGEGSVGCSLISVILNGQQSNEVTASSIPMDTNSWSNLA